MKAFSAVVASRNPIGCWEDTGRFNQILQEKYPESFRDEKNQLKSAMVPIGIYMVKIYNKTLEQGVKYVQN